MSILIQGRTLGLMIVISSFALFWWFMREAREGEFDVHVRTLPPLQAIPEAIGRAAEMGRPIYATTAYGGGTLNHARDGPQTVAGISIIREAVKLAAEAGVKVDYYTPIADSLPLIEETFRQSYLEAGKPEEFDTDMIQFQAGQSAYVTSSLGYFKREEPASTIMMGCFYYESVVLGEGANSVGAMQITGCAKGSQLPFLIATSDYVLIAEELFAAGAEISRDREQLATLRVEDWFKILFLGLIITGLILGAVNINIIQEIMRF
jgi:hypothetical protein